MKPKGKSHPGAAVALILAAPATPLACAELNDTGVQLCSDGATIGVACNDAAAGTDGLPGQDAEYGRDATSAEPGDGLGGFSFTKLDAAGTLLADQQSDYASSPWACVQDNVTGLTWEVKTNDDGVHDKDWTYSWYTSSGINDAGFPGFENGGTCVDTDNCDTEKFVAAVNAAGLCGSTDWRLPSVTELQSIVAYSGQPLAFPVKPSIDTQFFPNTHADNYYTSNSSASANVQVWVVYFGVGNTTTLGKSQNTALRLVRSSDHEAE